MSSAISPIAIVTASGTASPGPVLVLGMVFWYLLVTVVPFLVGVLATPNTYPTAGFRRGTATQVPRLWKARDYAEFSIEPPVPQRLRLRKLGIIA